MLSVSLLPQGWAATALFNPAVQAQLQAFKERSNTFSLGVCNGCQLLALLGWIGASELAVAAQDSPKKKPRLATGPVSSATTLTQNLSGRFESRFSAVKILPSRSILLKGLMIN